MHVPRPESDSGPGSAYLILALPETTLTQQQLDTLAGEGADAARGSSRRFDPAVMALDLADAVELLTAAVEAIPSDQMDPPTAQRLAATVSASLENLVVIQRYLRRTAAASVG